MSESTTSLGPSRLLDEVRAKIFYLASDVEPASQPAAMLLRAVAESIADGGGDSSSMDEGTVLEGLSAPLLYSPANDACGSDSVSLAVRHAVDVGPGHRR